MERITRETLRNMLNYLNRLTEKTYALDIAYGGYRLVQMHEKGDCSGASCRVSAREMYFILDALQHVIQKEQN